MSANTLVQLDEQLMPCCKQVTYAESWDKHADQWSMGLQDVRLFYHDETVFFFAAKPVGRRTYQVYGTCSCVNPQYLSDHKIITPTFSNPVGPIEKNWVFFPQGSKLSVIHSWHPLSICSINEKTNQLIRTQTVETPTVFKSFRGSTSAFPFGRYSAFVVHMVNKNKISRRKSVLVYHHRLVLLSDEGQPVQYSEPFKFGNKNVEYCIGAVRKDDNVLFSGSIRDAICCIWIISVSALQSQLRWSKV